MLLSTALSARITTDLRERGRPGRRHPLGGRRSSRPRLEVLEERALLSTWTVTDNSDNPSDPGSLRYAVDNAPDGSIIDFASGVTGTITLSANNGPLGITQNLDIDGPGANNLTISGDGADEVFSVNIGTVTIAGLTIADGLSLAGGGIDNAGTLTVTNCTLSGNTGGIGGGVFNSDALTLTNSTLAGNSGADDGGGIDNIGTLTVTNSTFSGNSTGADGGGIYNDDGALTVTDSTLASNSAEVGGGIYNQEGEGDGTPTLANTILATNTAPTGPDVDGTVASLGYNLIGNSSGGTGFVAADLVNVNPLLGPLQNNGGPTETMALLPGSPAIDAGSVALVPSGVTADQRDALREVYGGVDIGAFEVQVYAVDFTTDSGGGSLRSALTQANQFGGSIIAFAANGVIDLASPLPAISSDVQILGPGANNLTVSGNVANEVFQVNVGVTATIAGLTIADGFGPSGGGILNDGVLTVTNSTLSDNEASGGGGGIVNFGELTVSNSTLSGNSAADGGGGILNFATLTVSNSTLSGNSATDGGGGIGNQGTATLANSTLSGNSAGDIGGGIAAFGGAVTLANTIITTNTAPTGPDVAGTVTSLGHNLIGNSSGGTGFVAADLLNVNARLGPLQNNGGPTQTMALLPGSPAIAAGSVALIPPGITTDQRGSPRVVNGRVDIGAFESRSFIAGAPTQLVIHTQPSATATAGRAFATQPVIYEEDQNGNLETGDNSTQVTVSLESGSGPLVESLTVTVSGGIATFTNLADNTAGNIVLVFTSLTLAKAMSNPITISSGSVKGQVIVGSASVASAVVKVGGVHPLGVTGSEKSRRKNGHAIGGKSLPATIKPHTGVAVTRRPRQSSSVRPEEAMSHKAALTAIRARARVKADTALMRIPAKLKGSLMA